MAPLPPACTAAQVSRVKQALFKGGIARSNKPEGIRNTPGGWKGGRAGEWGRVWVMHPGGPTTDCPKMRCCAQLPTRPSARPAACCRHPEVGGP